MPWGGARCWVGKSGSRGVLQDLSDQSWAEAAGLPGERALDTPGPSSLKPSLRPPPSCSSWVVGVGQVRTGGQVGRRPDTLASCSQQWPPQVVLVTGAFLPPQQMAKELRWQEIILLGPTKRFLWGSCGLSQRPTWSLLCGITVTMKQVNMMLFDVFIGSLSWKQCWWGWG